MIRSLMLVLLTECLPMTTFRDVKVHNTDIRRLVRVWLYPLFVLVRNVLLVKKIFGSDTRFEARHTI